MVTFLNNNLALFNQIPEIFLTVALLFQLLVNLNVKTNNPDKHFSFNLSICVQTFFILTFTLILLFNCNYNAGYNNFLLINTTGTNTIKKIIVFASILALIPIAYGFNLQKLNSFEYYSLYLLSIVSSMLLISAGDFLSVYLLIEMQSLCFYVLATFRKNSVFSVEAGIKYFVFGSLISCILLYALSLLYGAVGTLNFHDLNLIFFSFPFPEAYSGVNNSVIFSLALICIVFLFKLGIVPFQFWVPDVYEGSPISSTIIFSFLPKLVLFDLFIKISKIFGDAFKEMEFLFIFTGLLSVAIGAFFALTQKRVKRFFIYSSISQMGFPIVLLSIRDDHAYIAIYFFLLVYTFSSILTWLSYLFLYQFSEKWVSAEERKTLNNPLYLTDLSGLYKLDKAWSLFFALVFFSLAGIPPLSGFLTKLLVVVELTGNHYLLTAILLVFFASVSTFYYVRVIKIMFFEPENLKKCRFNSILSEPDPLFMPCCIVAFYCLAILLHAFFFVDSWLLLSKYIYFNSYF